MTTATTRSRTRKAKAVAKDEAPQERKAITRLGAPTVPWVDEYLAGLRKSLAHAAAPEPRGWVDPNWQEDALAALNSAVDDAIAEHEKRAGEYDRQERALRGQRPVRHARPAQHVPVAVVTKSGAFYRINSRGYMEAAPMDETAEKHVAEFLRLHAEQDGPQDDPGPAAPVALPPAHREKGPAGPGSPDEDPALDEARDE